MIVRIVKQDSQLFNTDPVTYCTNKITKYCEWSALFNITIDDVLWNSMFRNINNFIREHTNANTSVHTSIPVVKSFPNKFVKIGTHKNVIVIDFNAFYPNIVREYQIYSQELGDVITKLLAMKQKGNKSAKLVLSSIVGIMNNEYSAIYDPHSYNEVIKYGYQIINEDINQIESNNNEVVFSNTDSIGFVYDDNHSELITSLNDKRVFIKYKIEHIFKIVWFVNVNKYIGITANDELIIKGYPKVLHTNESFWLCVRELLLNPNADMFDVLDKTDDLNLVKPLTNFINCKMIGPVIESLCF